MCSIICVSRKSVNNSEKIDDTLYMPNFFCSYLTYYAKITTDTIIYKDNKNYNGISFLIPHPSKEGDYVTLKDSNFNKSSVRNIVITYDILYIKYHK